MSWLDEKMRECVNTYTSKKEEEEKDPKKMLIDWVETCRVHAVNASNCVSRKELIVALKETSAIIGACDIMISTLKNS
jgi:hypothetical protein